MRPDRFANFTVGLINKAEHPLIKDAVTFRDAGATKAPYGVVINFSTGATAYLHTPATAAPGHDYDKPEQIIEGEEPIAPLPFPDTFGAGGQIKVQDLEAWLMALFASSGSREIKSMEAWTQRPNGRLDHVGITLHFHSDFKIYCAVAHLLRPGMGADRQEWYTPQEVA